MDAKTQLAIVLILKTVLAKGGIKSPMAYLNGLIMKARQDVMCRPAQSIKKRDKRRLIGRKKLAMQADIEKQSAGLGNFTRADLKLYGLFN